MERHHCFSLILLCAATAGCYVQKPLQVAPPPPATHVVAQLSDSGTVAMGNAIGPGALQVEGLVTSANDTAWTLQMLRVEQRGDQTVEWNKELVTFPHRVLINPVVVTLDKRRSFAAALGITATAYVLARVFNLVGANNSKDENPQPQQTLVGGRSNR